MKTRKTCSSQRSCGECLIRFLFDTARSPCSNRDILRDTFALIGGSVVPGNFSEIRNHLLFTVFVGLVAFGWKNPGRILRIFPTSPSSIDTGNLGSHGTCLLQPVYRSMRQGRHDSGRGDLRDIFRIFYCVSRISLCSKLLGIRKRRTHARVCFQSGGASLLFIDCLLSRSQTSMHL